MDSSVGLTSKICVVHPPPDAKWGTTIGDDDVETIGAMGNVVIRKSDRSLTKPRNATAPTGTDDEKVKVSAVVDPLNGVSLRNAAICWFGGIVVVPAPRFVPSLSVK